MAAKTNLPGIHRREFLRSNAAAPFLLASPFLASPFLTAPASAFAPEYDLVIRGGRVLDASQRIDRLADIAIRDGRIATIRPGIAASAAKETIDATGKLVTPGLIDLHAHLADPQLPPAKLLPDGVTTLLDGGSRGSDNADDLLAIAKGSPNRVRILLNIGHLGVVQEGELMDLANANVDATRRVIERNREWIVGVKARLSQTVAGDHDLEALRRARQVADPLKVPIMIHMGQTFSRLPEILALLRPGDIVTHLYSPPPHGILDDNGRVLAQVLEARRRGIRFDVGNGRIGHITWEVAERAIQQDFLPDTISSDMTAIGRTYQVFSLPNVMSKFLMLGMPVERVIACTTANAARSITEFKSYGTLRTGAVADVAVFDLQKGDFEFVDNVDTKRTGHQKLVPYAVVAGGKKVG
jgi:dihydroorotase